MNSPGTRAAPPAGPHADPRKGEDAPAVERVLVVDDDENIRRTLAEFLEMIGYAAEMAGDGTRALQMLGRGDYDLVLSDLRMPGIDGMALIEWVKETHPDLPVIVITGHATVESTIRALRLGAHDYLLKPFTLEEIDRTVGRCLEKRRLEKKNTELARMNQRLREIESMKDDLLATVSHEFRTPLTAMKGFLTLLDQTGPDNLRSDQRHALTAIRDSVARLDMMIANLLALTEVHNGEYRPQLEPVEVRAFLHEYGASAQAAGWHTSYRLELQKDVEHVHVNLDKIRFPLVLANLLDNAFKFARDPEQPEVILRAVRAREQVFFEVHDDGIGIAESLGEKVFDRFTQADMTSTREHSGAGLGLAVVREIVGAHGGTVRLVPPLLGGTSVRVSLPVGEGHSERENRD